MEESAGREIQQEADTSTENQNQSTESHNEAKTSSENENHNKWLVYNIAAQLGRPTTSPIDYRITKVPDHIRSVNPQAYTPMVISIAPIHHFDEKLQTMEKHKEGYLRGFISRANKPDITLEKFVSIIEEMEATIRCCYAETSLRSMSRDDFVKMILQDAIFILELFLRCSTGFWESDDLMQTNLSALLMRDLVLLENQLPFFVLEKLYNLAFDHHSNFLSLIQLTFNFFFYYNVQMMSTENVKLKHFTELMRAFQLPPSTSRSMPEMMIIPLLCSATQLHDAGVKFKKSTSSKRLLDLHFEKGVLEMPCLELDDQTEALVRNVMALEQLGHWNEVYFTEYFIFLDSLINTIEDVNLLCDRGILVNRRGDNKAALSLVKNLITNITCSGTNSNVTKICKGLYEFYQKPVHRCKATLSVTTLKNQYFNNPWRGAATIAACLLLFLTLIQTIMSILQVARA